MTPRTAYRVKHGERVDIIGLTGEPSEFDDALAVLASQIARYGGEGVIEDAQGTIVASVTGGPLDPGALSVPSFDTWGWWSRQAGSPGFEGRGSHRRNPPASNNLAGARYVPSKPPQRRTRQSLAQARRVYKTHRERTPA